MRLPLPALALASGIALLTTLAAAQTPQADRETRAPPGSAAAPPAAGKTRTAPPEVRSLPQFRRFLPTPRHTGAALPSWHHARKSADGQ